MDTPSKTRLLRDKHERRATVGYMVLWIVFPIDVILIFFCLLAYRAQRTEPSHGIITLPGQVITIKTNKV